MAGLPELLAAHERAAEKTQAAQGYLHPATTAGLASMFHDDPAAARAMFLSAIADAERAGDYHAVSDALLHLVEAEARLGNLTAATARAAQFQRLMSFDDGQTLYAIALAAAYRGDAATATDAATRGAKLARDQDDIIFTTQNLCTLGFLEVSRSQFTAALTPLREARTLTRRMSVREPSIYQWHAEHVEASLATGNLAEAAEITAELQALADALGRPALHALAGRCVGLGLAAQGHADKALSTLTAITAREDAELPFQRARSLLALGIVARRTRAKAAARDALTSAQAIFTSMGCSLWSQRTADELSRIGLRTAPATLTVTERRIAELVASGHTNREVAAELFLSVKTVEANLSRIYHKLHVTSRTQLAGKLYLIAPDPKGAGPASSILKPVR
jgi:DNA-binding CsgD family transcriptional regulator